MTRAPVTPSLVAWARERAGLEPADLGHRFPKLRAWEAGEIKPTLEQAKAFARTVHVPVGYLFLSAPPEEPIPVSDFRAPAGQSVRRPSPDLLDMLYVTQRRQDWYREYALATYTSKAHFVGSLTVDTPVRTAAEVMARELDFTIDARAACRTWEGALRRLVDQADRAGVLVMVSGVVLSNTHRRLDPQEFRGFALVDDHAPLVFINGADIRAGQMFTLAHELAHLWLGVSALSDADLAGVGSHRQKEEVWCDAVAAELLVPLDAIRAVRIPGEALDETLQRLSRRFKVSTLVILRRLLDAGALDRAGFDAAWKSERGRLVGFGRKEHAVKLERKEREMKLGHKEREAGFEREGRKGVGGDNFSRTTLSRVGRRFAGALVESTLEGGTLYRDAFRMLGVKKTEAFNNIGLEVGVIRQSELQGNS